VQQTSQNSAPPIETLKQSLQQAFSSIFSSSRLITQNDGGVHENSQLSLVQQVVQVTEFPSFVVFLTLQHFSSPSPNS